MEPGVEFVFLFVDKFCGFREAVLQSVAHSSKQWNFVGQQVDADQDRQNTLTRRNAHDQASHNAEPTRGMFCHELRMLIPDQPFHEV